MILNFILPIIFTFILVVFKAKQNIINDFSRLNSSCSKLETGELKLDEWKTLTHREPDWVELPLVKNHVVEQEYDEDQSEFIYEDDPRLRDFRLKCFHSYFCSLEIDWGFLLEM